MAEKSDRDIINYNKPIECDICHEEVDLAFGMDFAGELLEMCPVCMAHRFGTKESIRFMNEESTKKHRHF